MHKLLQLTPKQFTLILKNHAFIRFFSLFVLLGFMGLPVLGYTATVDTGWQDISSQVSISKKFIKAKKT